MSNSNSLNSGLQSGFHQGVKTGMSFSPMYSGLRNGYINGISKHDKVQDPTIGLIGNKKPLVFWLSDYAVYSGTTLTTLYNLIPGGSSLSKNSSPLYIDNGFLNNKSYINYDSSADAIFTSSSTLMLNKTEMSIVMLVKMTSGSTKKLFNKVDSAFASTIGDLSIDSVDGNYVRVTLIGNPTTTSSVYDTYDPNIVGSWFLLTVNIRLGQPNGEGSELEIYVNGTKNQKPITTTYGPTTGGFVGDILYFGNNSSYTQGGSQIAGAFVTDYCLNSAEQIRIENFFRWYYGYRF